MGQHQIRNLAALVRRASDDGARFYRIRKFNQITPDQMAERAFADYAIVPWPQRFVFYWDGFRSGYLKEKTARDQWAENR